MPFIKYCSIRRLFFIILLVFAGVVFYGSEEGCSCGAGTAQNPEIISVYPEDGAADVPVKIIIEAVFNKPMDAATINGTTFKLFSAAGAQITGTVGYSAESDKATFVGVSDLDYNTTYTVVISRDVSDEDGNPLGSDKSFGFTTGKKIVFSAELDTEFADGGKFAHSFDSKDDVGNAVVIQDDDKIVVSGYVNWSGIGAHDADLGVIRLDKFGNLDPNFGAGGEVVIDCNSFWGLQWWAQQGLALQSDGKILVGGECARNASVFRLNTDGSLDNTFGVAGRVDIAKDIGGGQWAGVFSLATQPDGAGGEKIIVGGIVNRVPDWNVQPAWILARFDSNGSLDASFGDQPAHPGIVIEGWGSTSSDGIRQLLVLSDRNLIAYGNTLSGTPATENFAMAKYTPDGVVDRTFGTNGLTVVEFGGMDWSYSAVFSSGGTIVGGEHIDCCFATSRFGVFRLTSQGIPDNTFGTEGKVRIDFGTNEQQIGNAVVSLPDGSLIVGGEVNNGAGGWDNNDFGLVMLNSDGTVQTKFGQNGFITTDFYGLEDGILHLHLQDLVLNTWGKVKSFKVVAVGLTKLAGHANRSFAVARYSSIPIEEQ